MTSSTFCAGAQPRAALAFLTEARSRLAAGEVKTKVKILAQIGYVRDARGHPVLSGYGGPAGSLDMDALGPQQDRHFGAFDFAFRLGAAA
jgi:hypothetical protein